jgi:hypothetical protein
MRREINDDNLYPEGAIISAKVNPSLKLLIMKYRQRIYYCSAVDHPEQNTFAYFERELVRPPGNQEVKFRSVKSSSNNYVFREETMGYFNS